MENIGKATEEEKKDAVEDLAKYDTFAEDDSRKRFLCVWDRDRDRDGDIDRDKDMDRDWDRDRDRDIDRERNRDRNRDVCS